MLTALFSFSFAIVSCLSELCSYPHELETPYLSNHDHWQRVGEHFGTHPWYVRKDIIRQIKRITKNCSFLLCVDEIEQITTKKIDSKCLWQF